MNTPARSVRDLGSIGYRKLGLMAALLVVWVVLTGASAVAPRSTHFRVGVLTSGGTFNLALDGLREGLAQLGYHEGKDIAFMVEDAQGEVASLAEPGRKNCGGQTRCHFHCGHRADGCGQAGHHDDSHRLRLCCRSAAVGLGRQLRLIAEQFDRHFEPRGPALRQAA